MKTHSTSPVTYAGLVLAFIGVPLVVYLFSLIAPQPYTDLFIWKKEMSIFLTTGLLLLLVTKGEKKGLDSIGLHTKHWGKSIAGGLGLAVILFAALVVCALALEQFGFKVGGNEGNKYQSISLWSMTLVTVRAGIVEEICYRGYIIERLDKLTNGNKWITLVFPVIIFALAHYTQGIAGLVISFVAGAIMAYVYWKKRDLKANIIAHFLVDFIPNVLLPLF